MPGVFYSGMMVFFTIATMHILLCALKGFYSFSLVEQILYVLLSLFAATVYGNRARNYYKIKEKIDYVLLSIASIMGFTTYVCLYQVLFTDIVYPPGVNSIQGQSIVLVTLATFLTVCLMAMNYVLLFSLGIVRRKSIA